MINLQESEKKEIVKTIHHVSQKWWGKSNSAENLADIHKEIVGRLEDLGFEALCDPTPTLENKPIEVVIKSRLDRAIFDYERKAYDLKRLRDRKEESPEIEGAA